MSIRIPKTNIKPPVDVQAHGGSNSVDHDAPALRTSNQTQIPIADRGAAGQTNPTNSLLGRLNLSGVVDVRSKAKARIQQLHQQFEALGETKSTEDLATSLRMLELDHVSPYGHLAGVLSTLTDVHFYGLDDGKADIPKDLRDAFETSYLAIFEDYLGATGDMITKLMASAKAEPTLRTLTSLEERGRYAASAARGHGKAENQLFAGLSDRFSKTQPHTATNLPAARSALKKLAVQARELHADLAGFDKGSLSQAGRSRLIFIDAPNADRALLFDRLDAVEQALDRGAHRLASDILSSVDDVVPSLGIMEVFGPLTEDKYSERLDANHAPISLDDARAVTARIKTLRPRVAANNLTNRLDELEALQTNGFETPRNIQYGAEGIVKRAVDHPIEPALLVRAQKLFLQSVMDQIEQPHAELRAVAPAILAATKLADDTFKAAQTALRLNGPVDQPESMNFLSDDQQSRFTSAQTTYADLRSDVQTKIQTLAREAFVPVAAKHAEILGWPEDQQQAGMQTLVDEASIISSLALYLPDSRDMSTLCNDIFQRSRPA